MSKVHGAWTTIHKHENGAAAVRAATQRARNSTIVIGADQDNGTLLIDIDVQAEICRDKHELKEQLQHIIEALDGQDMETT